jgi:hypothetical protein
VQGKAIVIMHPTDEIKAREPTFKQNTAPLPNKECTTTTSPSQVQGDLASPFGLASFHDAYVLLGIIGETQQKK